MVAPQPLMSIRTAVLKADKVWADPRSLAATRRVSIDLLSWGYLDGSIHPVGRNTPMYSA